MDIIINSNEETLQYLVRHMKIANLSTEDFMTKLDLIETHPKLFEDDKVMKQFTKEEIELLRVLVIANKPKLYGSKVPEKYVLDLIQNY